MTTKRIQEVIHFINIFKGKHPLEIEDAFYNGNCYWFARILQERFGGAICFNPYDVHFSVLIEDCLFDITGFANTKTVWYDWEDYQKMHDVSDIYSSCILKNND